MISYRLVEARSRLSPARNLGLQTSVFFVNQLIRVSWSMATTGCVQQRSLNKGLNLYLLQLVVMLHERTAIARGCINTSISVPPQKFTNGHEGLQRQHFEVHMRTPGLPPQLPQQLPRQWDRARSHHVSARAARNTARGTRGLAGATGIIAAASIRTRKVWYKRVCTRPAHIRR